MFISLKQICHLFYYKKSFGQVDFNILCRTEWRSEYQGLTALRLLLLLCMVNAFGGRWILAYSVLLVRSVYTVFLQCILPTEAKELVTCRCKGKTSEKWETLYFRIGRKTIILLEVFQAYPVLPFDRSNIKIKTEW